MNQAEGSMRQGTIETGDYSVDSGHKPIVISCHAYGHNLLTGTAA